MFFSKNKCIHFYPKKGSIPKLFHENSPTESEMKNEFCVNLSIFSNMPKKNPQEKKRIMQLRWRFQYPADPTKLPPQYNVPDNCSHRTTVSSQQN